MISTMAGFKLLKVVSLMIFTVFHFSNGRPNFIVMLMDDVSIEDFVDHVI